MSSSSRKVPHSPLYSIPDVPDPFRKAISFSRKKLSYWQPPTLLGISLIANVLMFTYIVYPEGGFESLQTKVPVASDLKYAVWFLGFFCLLRMIVGFHVYERLAYVLGAPDVTNSRKFSQQFMNLQLHGISAAYLWWYLPQQPWYHDISIILKGWPNVPITPSFMMLYMLQCGYHATSLVFHFTDEVRRDFLQMLLHHSVTIFLIAMSHIYNLGNYGALVLFLSDVSDVVGCLTKISNYLMKRRMSQILLPFLVFSWAYTRCYLLPFWVVATIPTKKSLDDTNIFIVISTFFCLSSLVVLNYIWLFLMIRMGINAILKKDTTDLSEFHNQSEEVEVLEQAFPQSKAEMLVSISKDGVKKIV